MRMGDNGKSIFVSVVSRIDEAVKEVVVKGG